MLIPSEQGESWLTRTFKPVAFIVLLALILPALLTASDCIGKSLATDRCQPDCPMMESNTNAPDRLSTKLGDAECCELSNRLPVNRQAAVALEKQTAGATQVHRCVADTIKLSVRSMIDHGTEPRVSVPSRQALLGVFLL